MGRYTFVGCRSPQGREQETNGPGSTGAAFGMENTVRLKNLYSGNSFIFILPCLKKSRGSVMAVSQVGYSVLRERCLWEVLVQRTGQVGTQQLAHSVLWWRQVHYPAGPPPPPGRLCVGRTPSPSTSALKCVKNSRVGGGKGPLGIPTAHCCSVLETLLAFTFFTRLSSHITSSGIFSERLSPTSCRKCPSLP